MSDIALDLLMKARDEATTKIEQLAFDHEDVLEAARKAQEEIDAARADRAALDQAITILTEEGQR